jgi:hypothetical protein
MYSEVCALITYFQSNQAPGLLLMYMYKYSSICVLCEVSSEHVCVFHTVLVIYASRNVNVLF